MDWMRDWKERADKEERQERYENKFHFEISEGDMPKREPEVGGKVAELSKEQIALYAFVKSLEKLRK